MEPHAKKSETAGSLAEGVKMAHQITVDETPSWFSKWVATSKPTEWISSITGILVVIGGLSTGGYLWFSGYLDNKKTEVENKNLLTRIETTKLEIAKLHLDADNKRIQETIAKNNEEMELTKGKILDLMVELDKSQQSLGVYRKQQAAAEAEKSAMLQFEQLNRAKPLGDITVERDQNFEVISVSLGQRENNRRLPKRDPIEYDSKREFFGLLPSFSKLAELHIESVKLTSVDVEFLANLQNIKLLSMKNCNLSDEVLSNTIVNTNIEHLNLTKNPISNLPSFINSNLISLNLEATNFNDMGILNIVQKLKGLQALILRDTKITKQSIESLRQLSNLKYVGIPSNLIDDFTIDIAGRRLESLKGKIIDSEMVFDFVEYDFKNTRITDKGILSLTPNESVGQIDLSETKITDASLTHLANFAHVQILDLSNTFVTAQGVNTYCQKRNGTSGPRKKIWIEVNAEVAKSLKTNGLPNPPVSEMINISVK